MTESEIEKLKQEVENKIRMEEEAKRLELEEKLKQVRSGKLVYNFCRNNRR